MSYTSHKGCIHPFGNWTRVQKATQPMPDLRNPFKNLFICCIMGNKFSPDPDIELSSRDDEIFVQRLIIRHTLLFSHLIYKNSATLGKKKLSI